MHFDFKTADFTFPIWHFFPRFDSFPVDVVNFYGRTPSSPGIFALDAAKRAELTQKHNRNSVYQIMRHSVVLGNLDGQERSVKSNIFSTEVVDTETDIAFLFNGQFSE